MLDPHEFVLVLLLKYLSFRYSPMSLNNREESSHQSHIRVLVGGVHETNREYVSNRLCEHIDGLISSQFIDNNNQVEFSFDTHKLDRYTLLSAIQRLGHPVQLINSESVQVQLRIEGMHCNSCVSNICAAVLDLPGAMDIQLKFQDKLATITYDPEILQLNDIIEEIENLNFQVAISNVPQLKQTAENSSSICMFKIRVFEKVKE